MKRIWFLLLVLCFVLIGYVIGLTQASLHHEKVWCEQMDSVEGMDAEWTGFTCRITGDQLDFFDPGAVIQDL